MKKSPPNIFTALDLELNQAESGAKIIQIGACVGKLDTGEILDRLSVYINPHEAITPYITQLTKITQEDVDEGLELSMAIEQLKAFHERYQSFVNFVTWGQGDVKALREESGLPLEFAGRREIDAKTLYVAYRLANGSFPTGGLSRAMSSFGMQFKGQAHDALDDSKNTFNFWRHLVHLMKVKNG